MNVVRVITAGDHLLRLAGIHQALFTDSIHHPWNTVRDLVDPIDGRVGKYVLRAARVLHVRIDVVLAFRPVEGERWGWPHKESRYNVTSIYDKIIR